MTPPPSIESFAVLDAVGLMKPNGLPVPRLSFSLKLAPNGFGFGLLLLPTAGTATAVLPLLLLLTGGVTAAFRLCCLSAALNGFFAFSSAVRWSMARVYVDTAAPVLFAVLAELVPLFNELRDELRRLLLEPDRSTTTGFVGAAALHVLVGAPPFGCCTTTFAAGLVAAADLAGAEGAATLVAAGFWTVCGDDGGVRKLLVRFGNSVFLAAATVGFADDLSEFDFLSAGTVFVTAVSPLLLVVSLLPLLSALAMVFAAGFSVSKLPDDVS